MEENNNINLENDAVEAPQPQEEAQAAETDANAASPEENAQTEENSTGYVSQFGEITGVSAPDESTATVKVKKKRLVMPCIIISACTLLVAIVVGVVFLLFFNTSVAGTYVIETEGDTAEIQTYFILGDDGKLTQRSGSIELEGTYQITNEDNESKINLSIPANYVNVTYNYKIEGNKLTGMKLIMSDDRGNSLIFAPATYVETTVEPIENAQLDSKLVGNWEDTEGYGLRYIFNDDYSLVMSGNGMNIYGCYSAENGNIKIKYYADTLREDTATYSFDGDKLVLNESVTFTKVSE
ncbi:MULTISPECIES: DUF5640 domain-containing protein [unclassified Ruminococcus]|uniref:DUF5640 domain-containing protein n=1 Tax=unclassified Ruminococcus TaxID=2608920 RepID=UPI00210D2ACF|nr:MULTISPECIES: DUF5640 domain-containing protein [unclassified Ruminococcus]MCQ4021650.1 hypothetical protein [Ruminococcus sp. zg-924]MCQ4114095.1 hypothetical protein [Ruminococcus sp. zg-921]